MKNWNSSTRFGFNTSGLSLNSTRFIRNTEYLTALDVTVFKYSRFIQCTFSVSEMCTKIVQQAFIPFRKFTATLQHTCSTSEMFAESMRQAFSPFRMFAAHLRQAFFPYRMFAVLLRHTFRNFRQTPALLQ